MNTGGEAAEQIVRMSLEGFEVAAKITGAGAKNIAILLYSILKEEKKTKGKARLTSMLRSGKELKVFTVKSDDLKKFTQEAKKYGVLYCVLTDRKNKDHNDCYHRAFFYVMGIASETRANINQMFNFKEDCIEPEGMHGGWQTSGTVKVCHLAFNLWNGYAEEGQERYFTPEELFCCEFAPYFMEGIKVRYPEYCRELPTPRKQTEISR